MDSDASPSALLWLAPLVIVALAGNAYFWFGTSPDAKRRMLRWYSILLAALVLGFIYFAVQPPLAIMLACAVFAAAMAVVQVRITAFCPRCARMIRRGILSARVDSCPRCGIQLDTSPPSTGGA